MGVIKGKDVMDETITSDKVDNSIVKRGFNDGHVNIGAAEGNMNLYCYDEVGMTSGIQITPPTTVNPKGTVSVSADNFNVNGQRILRNGSDNNVIGISCPSFAVTTSNGGGAGINLNSGSMSVSASSVNNVITGNYSIQTSGGIASYNGNEIATVNNQRVSQQSVNATNVNLANGVSTQILTQATITNPGNKIITVQIYARAAASLVLAALNSEACFAPVTIQVQQSGNAIYTRTIQIARSGTGTDSEGVYSFTFIGNVTSALTVFATAKEAGISLVASPYAAEIILI